jgi:hypothetical protein
MTCGPPPGIKMGRQSIKCQKWRERGTTESCTESMAITNSIDRFMSTDTLGYIAWQYYNNTNRFPVPCYLCVVYVIYDRYTGPNKTF